ncbi:hypothetical protein [uncultured Microbacterium sp.]|uniref:hypothetical protein n=1 Tax=uncultured Microbacterium sp. TaxID=191216 RepID=UPI0028E72D3C|nr:hypothetical protein [uncultured Microbacterium sp.]
MADSPEGLDRTLAAAERLAVALREPTLLVTLHRDLGDLGAGWTESPRKKTSALRWGIFTMSYAATEAFFNDVLAPEGHNRVLPLNPDRLRGAGQECGVELFTRQWGVRTRVKGSARGRGNRSRWATLEGDREVRAYLSDMKGLRDRLSHGRDPFTTPNASGALWVQKKGNSMNLMGVEGFLQACTDLASQTILAFGGGLEQVPDWPTPRRSSISGEKRPALQLLPGD